MSQSRIKRQVPCFIGFLLDKSLPMKQEWILTGFLQGVLEGLDQWLELYVAAQAISFNVYPGGDRLNQSRYETSVGDIYFLIYTRLDSAW